MTNLDDIRIASPCSADWSKMTGDERAKFCGLCKKNVYNLSAMTRQQALDLIRQKEGKLCVSFYRRFDGTVLTTDCPIGLKARARWVWLKITAAAASLLASITLLGCRSNDEAFTCTGDKVIPKNHIIGKVAAPKSTPQVPPLSEHLTGGVPVDPDFLIGEMVEEKK